jgi:hypothetical protein
MGKRSRIVENERNRVIGMLTARCCQQDITRQFNVHPSTISRLLSSFRLTWQVSARQRHRRKQKTMVRQDLFIVTTSKRKHFMSAPKVATNVWSEDKWPDCEEQVVTEYQCTRSETSCCGTFDSASSSNVCYLGSHPPALVFMWILQMDVLVFGVNELSGSSRKRHSTWSLWWCHDLVWNISHYGKTNCVTVNGTPNSVTVLLWGNRGSWNCAVSKRGSRYHILTR